MKKNEIIYYLLLKTMKIKNLNRAFFVNFEI